MLNSVLRPLLIETSGRSWLWECTATPTYAGVQRFHRWTEFLPSVRWFHDLLFSPGEETSSLLLFGLQWGGVLLPDRSPEAPRLLNLFALFFTPWP